MQQGLHAYLSAGQELRATPAPDALLEPEAMWLHPGAGLRGIDAAASGGTPQPLVGSGGSAAQRRYSAVDCLTFRERYDAAGRAAAQLSNDSRLSLADPSVGGPATRSASYAASQERREAPGAANAGGAVLSAGSLERGVSDVPAPLLRVRRALDKLRAENSGPRGFSSSSSPSAAAGGGGGSCGGWSPRSDAAMAAGGVAFGGFCPSPRAGVYPPTPRQYSASDAAYPLEGQRQASKPHFSTRTQELLGSLQAFRAGLQHLEQSRRRHNAQLNRDPADVDHLTWGRSEPAGFDSPFPV
jgi:hypothetical protein